MQRPRFVNMRKNDYGPQFGPRLKQARINAGLTLEGVATALGSNFTTIWRYEANRHRPSGPTIFALASLYQVAVGWLMGEDVPARLDAAEASGGMDATQTHNEAVLALRDASADLSDDAIRSIADYIRFLHDRSLRSRPGR